MKTQGWSQLLRFGTGEIGELHRNGQHLFLKKHDTVGPVKNWYEIIVNARIDADYFFQAGSASDQRRGEPSHDRSGAHDRNLNSDVIKIFRLDSGECRHLGARFDLKHADRIGSAHHFVGGLVIIRYAMERKEAATALTKMCALLQHGHHAEPEKIDFNQTEVFGVVFIPLHDGAVFHRTIFDRNNVIEAVRT